MGGTPWMMFTQAQAQELEDNTTNEWTGRGYKFTSKTDSAKYIFIPAAGFWNSTTLVHAEWNNYSGFYWSTKYKSSLSAYYLVLESNGVYLNSSYRSEGTPIRSVATPNPW